MDPALHYSDIPAGCRLSNGVAVMVMVSLLLSVYALTNLKSASAHADALKLHAARGHGGVGGGGGFGGGGVGGFGLGGGLGGLGDGPREAPSERLYYGTQHLSDHLVPQAAGPGGSPVPGHNTHLPRPRSGHAAAAGTHTPEDSVSALEGFEEATAQLSGGGGGDEFDDEDDDERAFGTEASHLLS